MITGNPIVPAISSPSSGDSTGPGEPGTVGTLSFWAILRAVALSPIWRIYDHRKPDRTGDLQPLLGRFHRARRTGHRGHLELLGDLAGRGFVSHLADL